MQTNKIMALNDKVYELILAIANPTDGTVRVTSKELVAMMGTTKYTHPQVVKSIQALVNKGKLEWMETNGPRGSKYRIPELYKGNTVTRPVDTLADREKERLGIGNTEIDVEFKLWLTEQKRVREAESTEHSSLIEAVMQAESTLAETENVVAAVMKAFMRARRDLEKLVRETRKNA